MAALRFQKKVERSKDEFIEEFLGKELKVVTYFNQKRKKFYRLTEEPPEALVPKHEIVKLSDQLWNLGYTGHFDDLAKMIEKARKKQFAVA